MSQHDGIMDVPSNHSVDETVEKLKAILAAKGVTLFALVDHSGEAEKVGMKMPPTKLLIFGSPKAGTPVMIVALQGWPLIVPCSCEPSCVAVRVAPSVD